MHQERWWRKLPEEGAKTLKGGADQWKGGADRPHLAAVRPPVASGVFSILPESARDVSRGG